MYDLNKSCFPALVVLNMVHPPSVLARAWGTRLGEQLLQGGTGWWEKTIWGRGKWCRDDLGAEHGRRGKSPWCKALGGEDPCQARKQEQAGWTGGRGSVAGSAIRLLRGRPGPSGHLGVLSRKLIWVDPTGYHVGNDQIKSENWDPSWVTLGIPHMRAYGSFCQGGSPRLVRRGGVWFSMCMCI